MACNAGFGLYNLIQGRQTLFISTTRYEDLNIILFSFPHFSYLYTSLLYRKVHLNTQNTCHG